ncbi:hypothetical protein cyc_03573 [Cyclospora cayetanensis]|uniref:Palmitoyltransferase n=1 Tax=Cyclospora cayetanensis TaxID=88456 RepID=A0A1D3CZG6_9EIME|nr:hypothetical protein cyc_03573 [Cyclospora cayetanensis]
MRLRSLLLPLFRLLRLRPLRQPQQLHSGCSNASSRSSAPPPSNSTGSSTGNSTRSGMRCLFIDWTFRLGQRSSAALVNNVCACFLFFCSHCDHVLRFIGRILPWIATSLVVLASYTYFFVLLPLSHSPGPSASHSLLPGSQQQQKHDSSTWQQLFASWISPEAALAAWLLFNTLFNYRKAVCVTPGYPPIAHGGALPQQRVASYAELSARFCSTPLSLATAAIPPAASEKDVSSDLRGAALLAAAPNCAPTAELRKNEAETSTEAVSVVSELKHCNVVLDPATASTCPTFAVTKEDRDLPERQGLIQAEAHSSSRIKVLSSLPLLQQQQQQQQQEEEEKEAPATVECSLSVEDSPSRKSLRSRLASSSTSNATNTPTEPQASSATWLVCGKCNRLKGPRTRHCRACGICVVRQDHHCPWISQCVGVRNARYFLGLLLFGSLLALFGTVVFLPPAAVALGAKYIEADRREHAHAQAALFRALAQRVLLLEKKPAIAAQPPTEEALLEPAELAREHQLLLQHRFSAIPREGLLAKGIQMLLRLGVGLPPAPPPPPTQLQLNTAATQAWRAAAAAASASLADTDAHAAAAGNTQQHAQQGEPSEEARSRALAAGLAAARESVAASATALAGPPPFSDKVYAFLDAAIAAQGGWAIRHLMFASFCVALNVGVGVFFLLVAHLYFVLSNQTTLSIANNLDAREVLPSEHAAGGPQSLVDDSELVGGKSSASPRSVGLFEFLVYPFVSDEPCAFSPYNRGWRKNMEQVLGPRPLLAILCPWVKLPQEILFQ